MQMIIGKVKEWHNPRDESCPHNGDVARDCECKRPRKKKPYRRVVVTDDGVGHRTNPTLIFEIYPNGTVALREKKRKQRFYIAASLLYSLLMQRAALAHLAAKRKARADRKKARRAGG
jgi:hypothetical protein